MNALASRARVLCASLAATRVLAQMPAQPVAPGGALPVPAPPALAPPDAAPMPAAPATPAPATPARSQPPPVILFCSPIPPPLDAPVAAVLQGPSAGPAAPAGLAQFVNEPFYAPLASRLDRNDLDYGMIQRLGRYKTEKALLLEELRAVLNVERDAEEPAREQRLQQFAREQTPRVAALEAEAEAIRRDLCTDGEGHIDYFRWRLAHMGIDAQSELDRTRVALAFLRADMYYREGLSPAQRRLVRELVLELAESAEPDQAPKGAQFLFSPETARITFDRPPAAPLGALLVAYKNGKSAVKTELARVLLAREGAVDGAQSIASLRALAAAQAPRIAALEAQAEEIRRALAAAGTPGGRDEMAGIPAELRSRIAAYRSEKLALQKNLLAQVDAAKRAAGASDAPAVAEAIRRAIADFTALNADRYAELSKSRDRIRQDLGTADPRGPAPASQAAMLEDFSASQKKLLPYWDYQDYRNAVTQPGLSPEQRRLLLDGALQKLALPLPRGERLFDTH